MLQLGERIEIVRKKNNLTQADLANKSNLTILQIEELEQSNILPSLSILTRICRALDIKIDFLLDGTENEDITITRRNERKESPFFSVGSSRTKHKSSTCKIYSLAPTKSNRVMEPSVIELFNNDSESLKSSHEGEEFFYVIRGEIQFGYGSQQYNLYKGDSIYFDSIVPHNISSISESSKIITVTYTPL